MPLLDKLSEHLAIVAELRGNPLLCLLVGLKLSETELIDDTFHGDDKGRIDFWLGILNSAKDHEGDCVNIPITCLLCHVVDTYKEVKGDLNADKFTDEGISRLIQVMLGTELDVSPLSCNNMEKVQQFFDYQCDMVKRRESWARRNEEERRKVKERMGEMMEYMKLCLRL